MEYNRYHEVNINGGILTGDEMADGWHFCPYSNYLLVGPGTIKELKSCFCRVMFDNEEAKQKYFEKIELDAKPQI
jgi:hypothetical protein